MSSVTDTAGSLLPSSNEPMDTQADRQIPCLTENHATNVDIPSGDADYDRTVVSEDLVKCSPGAVENDELLKPGGGTAVVTTKLFQRRWLMIFLFASYSMSNAYQWIHLNIIFDKVCFSYSYQPIASCLLACIWPSWNTTLS